MILKLASYYKVIKWNKFYNYKLGKMMQAASISSLYPDAI